MDIAQLGLEVRSDGVVVATDRLGKLEGQSAKTERATDGLTKAAMRAVGAFAAMAAASLSIGGYVRLADQWSDMQSQLGAATKDMAGAGDMMMRMADIANASYAPLDQTVKIYARNVGVLRELGYTAAQAADFTEGLNHALVVTATKGEQAASVQNALAKAMAVGKLQADGLETVLANGGRLAEAFAEELGTTVNGLRQMAADGKITGKVMTDSLLNSLEKLRKEAGEMPATVADGFQRIMTGVQMLVGVFDQATGGSGAFAGSLVALGDALYDVATWARENGQIIRDVFNTVIGTAIVSATGLIVYFGISWVGAMLSSATATGVLTGAVTLLGTAIGATGFGLLVIGAGYLVGKFMELVSATGSFSKALGMAGEVAREFGGRMLTMLSSQVETFRAHWSLFVGLAAQAFSAVLTKFAEMNTAIVGGLADLAFRAGKFDLAGALLGTGAAIEASIRGMTGELDAFVIKQAEAAAGHLELAAGLQASATAPMESWKRVTGVIDEARDALNQASDGMEKLGKATAAVDKDKEKFINALNREVEELTRLKEALRQGDEAYNVMAETIEWENALREHSIDRMSVEAEKLREQIRLRNELRGAIEIIQGGAEGLSPTDRTRAKERFEGLGDQLRDNIANPAARLQAQYEEQLKIVDQYERAYKDKTAEAAAARLEIERQYQDAKLRLTLSSGEQAAGALAGAFREMLGEQSAAYKAMFAIQQGFVIATAALNIADAMSDALASGATIYEKMAAMAVIATNAAQIMSAVHSVSLGFANGGYTGAGGVNDVAGLVHKGEVVWSQRDVARYGGWQNVDAMRRGGPIPAANDNGGGRQQVEVHVSVSVDDDGRLVAYVQRGMEQAVQASVTIAGQQAKAQRRHDVEMAERPKLSARG